MSDLMSGGSASAAAGNSHSANNGASRAPAPVGSPSGIRGPRDIMRDRAAREARKKAEQEAQEHERIQRARAEEEARLLEVERQKAERRAAAAVAAAGAASRPGGVNDGTYKPTGAPAPSQQQPQQTPQTSDARRAERMASDQPSARGEELGRDTRQRGPSQAQSRPSRTTEPAAQPQTATATPKVPATEPPSARNTTRSSFPHAFERWETLSSHWEGLTSYWIRRLEENANEVSRDPLSQQLARQVTDLSAAGANLFHAVVELQRLRASSERKFQRWFFETRAEQERAQEMQAMLENSLAEERRGRADAIASAVARQSESSNSEKLLAEMRRELQISKEEARRAWEELGRREQEERDRTASLKEGHPTIVGGVQVVPMMQGVPTRQAGSRDVPPTREGPYAGGPASGTMGGQTTETQEHHSAGSSSARSAAQRSGQPATSRGSPYGQYSQAPAVQPATTGYYQPETTLAHDPTGREHHNPSAGTYSDEEYTLDASGRVRRDEHGNPIRYHRATASSEEGSDEYDARVERERELAQLQHQYSYEDAPQEEDYEYPPGTTAGSNQPNAPDYAGAGYGYGWEAMPRHHHPTRLSDVLEEDERSRTDASTK